MNYEVLRTRRKTISIQVYRDQRVQVRAPLRCKDKEIETFVAKHNGWVEKKIQESLQYPGLAESQYINGGSLWLLGESLAITVKNGSPGNVRRVDNQIVVLQNDITDSAKIHRLITGWKRDFASNLFQQQLAFWAGQFPLPLRNYQFRLRKMKRQWGNCNHRANITINSQLIRYPLSCIDYVIVHELTHLKHLHHGRAFYQLLEKVMPDWQQHKLLLSQFSGSDQPA